MQWENDLVRDIRIGQKTDDETGEVDRLNKICKNKFDVNSINIFTEFSPCNKACLERSFLTIKDWCKCIVEIGVYRNGTNSSTHIFINNKKHNTLYLGIDIIDKAFLNNINNNQYTLKTNSSNYDEIVTYLHSIGQNSIDYLFIDGYHSINQVLKDWEFTRLLSDNGIVGFHDTTYHLGPSLFIEALNPDIWKTETHCNNSSDWGIGFAQRINI